MIDAPGVVSGLGNVRRLVIGFDSAGVPPETTRTYVWTDFYR